MTIGQGAKPVQGFSTSQHVIELPEKPAYGQNFLTRPASNYENDTFESIFAT